MSHYQHDPTANRFRSNKYVDLSLDEMRYEYYKEMEDKQRQPKTKLLKRHPVKSMDFEMPAEHECRKRPHESDSSDTEAQLATLKRMKLSSMKSPSHSRSINDLVDMLSKSILKSFKKSNRHLKQRTQKKKRERELKQQKTDEDKLVETITNYRKLGNESLKIGDYERAVAEYSESLTINPRYHQLSSLSFANRAFALMKLGRFEEALNDCNAALGHDNLNVKAKLRRIICLTELNRFEEAKRSILELKQDTPLVAEECEQLLTTVVDKSEFAQSIELGLRLENEGDFEGAIEAFHRANSFDNTSAAVFENRARVYAKSGRYRESLNDLNEAMRLNPIESLRLLFNRARLLMKLERFQEAIRDAETVHRSNPSPDSAQLLRECINAEKVASKRNYYEILELDSRATQDQIKKQYRKMALKYHPDKMGNADPSSRAIAEEKFKQLQLIFKTLSDPASRRMYDMKELRKRF